MRFSRILAICLPLLVVGTVAAEAQIWTPSYASPRSAGDYGVYVNSAPADFSLEGIVRMDMGIHDIGFRGGLGIGDETSFLLGADLRSPFSIEDVPVEFAFIAGAQALLGGGESASFGASVGPSIGYTLVPGDFSLTPYIHPRLGLVAPGGESGITASFLGDIGVDFNFAPGVVFRVAFGLGSETADWGLGVSWR